MPNKLYKVPFTFTLTAVALVAAESPEAARDWVEDTHVFDETNIDESNVFWETGAAILKSDCASGDPQVSEAAEIVDPSEVKDLCEAYEIDLNDVAAADDEEEEDVEGLDENADEENEEEEARNRRDLEHG